MGVCSGGPAAPSEGAAFALCHPGAGRAVSPCVPLWGVGVFALVLLTPLSVLCWRETSLAHACELWGPVPSAPT